MAAFQINSTKLRRAMGDITHDVLLEVADALSVVQLEQISAAFRNGGQPGRKWPTLWADRFVSINGKQSYRAGGQPLLDNGTLAASFNTQEKIVTQTKVRTSIGTPIAYALSHQNGMKTPGPNYIPLTLKGRRLHQTGANPVEEGLVSGVDFFMAWGGVNVPARPMIDYQDDTNNRQIEQTINDVLGA